MVALDGTAVHGGAGVHPLHNCNRGPGGEAGGQPLEAGDSHRYGKRAEPSVGTSTLTGKMVVKTDLCQKVLEGHTNAINLD